MTGDLYCCISVGWAGLYINPLLSVLSFVLTTNCLQQDIVERSIVIAKCVFHHCDIV